MGHSDQGYALSLVSDITRFDRVIKNYSEFVFWHHKV